MENQEIIWKDVVGYEGVYKISSCGKLKRIYKTKKDSILKCSINQSGYVCARIRINGGFKNIKVHRLVCIAFLENPLNKPHVNHKNGIKTDNRLENLEWVTPLENNTHALETGLVQKIGEKHSSAKLTTEQVLKIRELSSQGISGGKIAKIIGIVGRNHINDIIKRKKWRHI
jgi:hypothetical protein